MSLLKWTDFAQNAIIYSTISTIYVLIPYLNFDENDFDENVVSLLKYFCLFIQFLGGLPHAKVTIIRRNN